MCLGPTVCPVVSINTAIFFRIGNCRRLFRAVPTLTGRASLQKSRASMRVNFYKRWDEQVSRGLRLTVHALRSSAPSFEAFCGVREQRIRFYPSSRRMRFSGMLPRRAVSINAPNRISRIGIKTAQLRRHRSCTAHAVPAAIRKGPDTTDFLVIPSRNKIAKPPAIRPMAMIQSTSGKSR